MAAAPPSNGSARASTRCAGPGCLAAPSATMRSGCSSMPLPTTSPTSCAHWRCPKWSSSGRLPRCARSWSRSAPGSCGTVGTSCSSWPRLLCRERCSPRSCAGSTGCVGHRYQRPEGANEVTAGAEGKTMPRKLVSLPGGPGQTPWVAFRRSREPYPQPGRTFRLTNVPLGSTVEPENGGYPGNLGLGYAVIPFCTSIAASK